MAGRTEPRIVRTRDIAPTPWPNGRGLTRDIAHHDGVAGRDWIVTLADLTEDAPFSHLPDIDRVFTLVEGGPVELAFDGATRVIDRLVPAHFPGDRPTAMRLLAGPARAFNLMAHRSRFRMRVEAGTVAAGHGINLSLDRGVVRAVFCAEGALVGDGVALNAGDAWLAPEPSRLVAGRGGARFVIAEIAPRTDKEV